MRSKYFTFLYSECKRLTNSSVTSEEINQFINTPEGERGFKAFCSNQKMPTEQPRPKSFKSIFESNEDE